MEVTAANNYPVNEIPILAQKVNDYIVEMCSQGVIGHM